MMLKQIAGLAFAASCLTAIATMPAHAEMAGAHGSTPGDSSPQGYPRLVNQADMAQSPTARQNVIQSQRYDHALEANRGFRQARMRKECGPITDPELRQSCVASFTQDEPYAGSSTARRTHRSEAGR